MYILRPILAYDIEDIYKGLSNPEVTKYYGVSFDTLEDTKEQMMWYEELIEEDTGIWWTIRSEDGSVFYGAIGLNDIHDGDGEIGYWLLPEYWGKGIISQVIPQVLDHGFNTIGLQGITAEVESGNDSSIRLLEKEGFQFQPDKTKSEVKDGRSIQVDSYRISR